MTQEVFVKGVDEVLDYQFDWSQWLASDSPIDTISSATITAETGIDIDGQTNTTSSATVTLSGGTLGQTYTITCEITTAAGRTPQRTMKIIIRNK